MQVNDALEPYAHALGVSLRLVAGGLSMTKQVQALERGVHLVVAIRRCRLADLVRRGHADLRDVEITVLDEADHMAQMGFMEEITEILAKTPRDGQRLLFSATLDGDVEALIEKWMHSPVTHDVTESDAPAHVEHVGLDATRRTLNTNWRRASPTATAAPSRLCAPSSPLTELRSRCARQACSPSRFMATSRKRSAPRPLRASERANIPVLVATDVAARGIHVDHVDLVAATRAHEFAATPIAARSARSAAITPRRAGSRICSPTCSCDPDIALTSLIATVSGTVPALASGSPRWTPQRLAVANRV